MTELVSPCYDGKIQIRRVIILREASFWLHVADKAESSLVCLINDLGSRAALLTSVSGNARTILTLGRRLQLRAQKPIGNGPGFCLVYANTLISQEAFGRQNQ